MVRTLLRKLRRALGISSRTYGELPVVPVTSLRLKDFFHLANLKILDVGARGGPYRQWEALAPYAELVLCEPDLEEATRLKNTFAHSPWKKVTIVPEALGTGAVSPTLYSTRYPGLSSLLQPDRETVARYFPSRPEQNKESREAWDVVAQKNVSLLSLDETAEKYNCRDISILKLDTQGTELDIVRSGEKKVLPETLAIFVEAEFVPLYRHQPLFSDVHSFLESQGFRMFDIKRTMMRRLPQVAPPIFSRRELLYAHALYLRERDIEGGVLSPEKRIKLAAVAVVLWFFDYALDLLVTPDIKDFLQKKNIVGVEDEVRIYAASVWRALERGMPRHERKKYMKQGYQDRAWEL